MEEMVLYYLGASVAIGFLMEILVKLDKMIEAWSLDDVFMVLGFPLTWLQLIGIAMSVIAAAFLTVTGGLYWLFAVAGAIAIYFTEFGAGKVGWRKIFELVYNIAKALSKK
jgi:hypothetical protein